MARGCFSGQNGAAELLDCTMEHHITEEDLARLIASEQGQQKDLKGRTFYAVLHQYEEKEHRAAAEKLVELLRRQGCRKVFAVVTSANEPSLAFHRSIGYRDAAHFRQVGYKFGRWYDVTWLEKSLCPPGEPSEFPISWKEVL